MLPSRNSTLVTKPPTRARTATSWTASKRPVNSSQSVTVRFTGSATVTGGAAAAGCLRRLVAAGSQRKRRRRRQRSEAAKQMKTDARQHGRASQLLSRAQSHAPALSTSRSMEMAAAEFVEVTDVIHPQSRQEPAGIKHNRYAAMMLALRAIGNSARKCCRKQSNVVGHKLPRCSDGEVTTLPAKHDKIVILQRRRRAAALNPPAPGERTRQAYPAKPASPPTATSWGMTSPISSANLAAKVPMEPKAGIKPAVPGGQACIQGVSYSAPWMRSCSDGRHPR